MADENKPEPQQRVRYNMAVTVDGVTHPAKTYEVAVPQSSAKALVDAGRATLVSQQPTAAAPGASAVAPVSLTPEQVAAVAAALTQPAAQPEATPAPVTPAASAAPAAPPKS